MRMNRMRGIVFALGLYSGMAFAQPTPLSQSLLNKGNYTPDIATFLNIGANSPAGYSWDGSAVYFTSSQSGSSQVYRLTEQGWPYQLTSFEDGVDFFTPSWNYEMAVVGASVGGDEQSQLFLMNNETGQLYQLTDNAKAQFGSVVWNRDDLSIFYRSNEENGKDFFIYQKSISDGSVKKIFGDSTVLGANSISDLSQDGKWMIISNYSSNVNNDMYLLNLATLKYSKLTKDEGDVRYFSPTLMPDNKTIWLICDNNPDGILRLAKMTVGSTRVEFVDDGWLDPRWEIEGLSFSRDFRYQAVLLNEDGYNRFYIRETDSKKPLKSPAVEGMQGGGWFDQNGKFLFSFNGPTRTSDVWLFDPRSGDMKQLTYANYAGIDRTRFVDAKLVRIKSFDGLEVPAFLFLPPNYQPGTPMPFIIDAHGGPEGQSQPTFARNRQYLLLNGIGIIEPNPRGSSGYGKEFISLDDYKLRKNSLKDYKAVADWLIEQGYSKAGMLGIRGGSYGGYVALGMITEYPDLFSASVCNVGIANFVTFLQNTAAYRRAIREAEYGPLTDTMFLHEISPLHKADDIRTPLLVVHGANDPRVPVGEARQIIEAIQKNGGVVDSLIFANEGHGSGKRENIIIEYRKQVEFFQTHLGKSQMALPPKNN